MSSAALTYCAMPGSSPFDTTLPPKLDTKVGARSHVYRLPNTPSASSSLQRSTASLTSQNGDVSDSRSRKRSRRDSATFEQATPYSATANGWTDLRSSVSFTPGSASPPPFVNTRYILAGGLDTPTGAATTAFEAQDYGHNHSRAGYQRGRSGAGGHRASQQDSYFPSTPPPLSCESNGRSRVFKPSGTKDGWGKAVVSVLGGVVGKAWEFCTANAFRGFYSGGGQSFEMRQPHQTLREEQSMWLDVEEKEEPFRSDGRESTPIPGQFPEEEFIPDYLSRDHDSSPRPAKKVKRQNVEGPLKANWVLVSNTPVSREKSPSRVSARMLHTRNSPERRPPTASGRPVACKAGRRPILLTSRPSLTSNAGSPALHSGRPTSFASSRSPGVTPTKGSKVLSPEAKMRKRELDEDASMKRFNQQLKAMIKEGKEALGTKVEIDDEMDGMVDEGYAEGEGFSMKTEW